jgi:photosystem II stability/assembly factor-like uncharacterized protein
MRTMALLSLTILLFSPEPSSAQWTRTAGPEGGRVSEMITTPTSVIVALEGGSMYRSTNSGTSWTLADNGLGTVRGEYGGIVRVGGTLFAATSETGLYRSTNDGLSWVTSNNGLTGGAIWVTAITSLADTLVIATSGGVMYRSTNGGALWTISNAGMPPDTMFGALGTAGTTMFAGSDEGGGVFASTDGGRNWFRSSSGLAGQGQNVLCFASTGSTIIAGTRSGAYRSTDNGAHWALCSTGLTSTAVSTLFAWGADLFAGTYGNNVYRSTNAGVDWARTPGKLGNPNVRALTAVGSLLLAGTYGPGTVYRTSDLGTTWTAVGSGITCEGVPALAVHAGKIVAVSFDGLMLSSNQGAVWAPADTSFQSTSAYSVLSRGSDIFVGTTGKGIYRSTDGAATWFSAGTALNGNARTVWSMTSDGGTVYAGTSSGAYRSTNDGGAWVQATMGIPDSVIRRVFARDGTLLAGTFSSLHRSTDAGSNWTPSTVGLPQYFQPEAFAVADSFMFVATYSGVYRTSDRGVSWTDASVGLPSAPDVRSLFTYQLPLPEAKLLFAGLGNGGVYVSANRGLSWFDAGAGLAGGVEVLSLAGDPTRLYAGTYAHSLWSRPIAEMIVAVRAENGMPEKFELLQNYPNPFNPLTVIGYRLPVVSDIRLVVFDLLGREVSVLAEGRMDAGAHEVEFDASALPSGVYFYRLQAGGTVATKRLLLLR